MNFSTAADELHRQEFSRLAAAVTPRPEQLRSMTEAALRDEIAQMWDRLGHDVITGAAASDLVTVKGARKFVTACANPTDPSPAGSSALRRLRDRVVALSAERGFFVSVRGFTAEAEFYAETARVELIDCAQLIRAFQRSRKGMLMPQTYKAMCRQCGDIVEHRLASDQAVQCGNGHFVAPSIALADLIKPRPRPDDPSAENKFAPTAAPKLVKCRSMNAKAQRRRAIAAHNRRRQARAVKRPRAAPPT